MKNFAKSVLNYFAAFNETRFRFSRKLPYDWSDDSFTLDLSVFPVFQKRLLEAVASGDQFRFEISKDEYVVKLDGDILQKAILAELDSELTYEFLCACIDQVKARLRETFPDQLPSEFEEKAVSEGVREYNIACRKLIQQVFTTVQDRKIKELQSELGFEQIPPTSFNPQREIQWLFNEIQGIAKEFRKPDGYPEAVAVFLREQSFAFNMFDLHPIIMRYHQLIGTQSIYLFFHEIAKDGQKNPIFTIEIEIDDGDQIVVVRAARDVIMLNTPAINNFEFDTVLTTPRACRFEDGAGTLSVVERFLQAKYNVPESFLLATCFRPLLHEDLPVLRYRIGLQAVREEDRRILDYSEILTSLDHGAGHKFIDMVSQYVDGGVPNTADDVQQTYLEDYPRKSVERIIPKRLLVPLSLNEIQKKILTAVENTSNRIIVVDGPPGTGKSYTIAAIVYLANQLNKSVVICSHKKQALDVIDTMLTNQFKALHPRSKPTMLRMEKSRGPAGINSIENTLSGPVINNAHARSQEFNQEAVASDREDLHSRLDATNSIFWENASRYDEHIRMTFEWVKEAEIVHSFLPEDASLDLPLLSEEDQDIDLESVKNVARILSDVPVAVSLSALVTLSKGRDVLPSVLEQCDRLNRLGPSLPMDLVQKVDSVPANIREFEKIFEQFARHFEDDISLDEIKLNEISPPSLVFPESVWPDSFAKLVDMRERIAPLADLEGKWFKSKERKCIRGALEKETPRVSAWLEREGVKPLQTTLDTAFQGIKNLKTTYPFFTFDYLLCGHREVSPDRLITLLESLSGLEFSRLTSLIADLSGKPFEKIPIVEIRNLVKDINRLSSFLELRESLKQTAELVGANVYDLPGLFTSLKQVQELLTRLENKDIDVLTQFFNSYEPPMEQLGAGSGDISGLSRLVGKSELFEHLFNLLRLHKNLSASNGSLPPSRELVTEYFLKSRKLLDHATDHRFSRLLHHAADVERIQTAIAAGKRISSDQAKVLLGHLSCIIAEPELISRHFPMEEDLIDLLIIDEASQVSIAESISLMLRARQTIVFGDELQYGAVGAVNVSQRYAEYYFKDILRDYALDRNQAISEEEKDRIAKEASLNPGEDDEESSTYVPIQPGTREWLKTFSVRTSTLAFARALRNYSATLNVHFRSFPEIISYSNEFFYKKSEIELITNRIRTKPIGEVLRFIKVETQGNSGRNVNLDEIDTIRLDLERLIAGGYKGTIGVICSFREQTARMEEIFRCEMSIYPDLVRHHRFCIWFVGDVQGEERDLIYYSFIQDKKIDNADLRTIYPIIGGTADNIRRLKMQRLNVGFSRAKDVMVFVHSMDIGDYSDTRLGDALRHYEKELTTAPDQYVPDERAFGSPAEKMLYGLILKTPFFQKNRDRVRLIVQFEIGRYIQEEYHRHIPKYRVDFLLTRTDGGKEKSLIIEYDGVEFHTQNPDIVTRHNFDREFLEYDIQRQLELENYGYSFLRINKFSLTPRRAGQTKMDVLNSLLERAFGDESQ